MWGCGVVPGPEAAGATPVLDAAATAAAIVPLVCCTGVPPGRHAGLDLAAEEAAESAAEEPRRVSGGVVTLQPRPRRADESTVDVAPPGTEGGEWLLLPLAVGRPPEEARAAAVGAATATTPLGAGDRLAAILAARDGGSWRTMLAGAGTASGKPGEAAGPGEAVRPGGVYGAFEGELSARRSATMPATMARARAFRSYFSCTAAFSAASSRGLEGEPYGWRLDGGGDVGDKGAWRRMALAYARSIMSQCGGTPPTSDVRFSEIIANTLQVTGRLQRNGK